MCLSVNTENVSETSSLLFACKVPSCLIFRFVRIVVTVAEHLGCIISQVLQEIWGEDSSRTGLVLAPFFVFKISRTALVSILGCIEASQLFDAGHPASILQFPFTESSDFDFRNNGIRNFPEFLTFPLFTYLAVLFLRSLSIQFPFNNSSKLAGGQNQTGKKEERVTFRWGLDSELYNSC